MSTMHFYKGDVVLFPYPFSDLDDWKGGSERRHNAEARGQSSEIRGQRSEIRKKLTSVVWILERVVGMRAEVRCKKTDEWKNGRMEGFWNDDHASWRTGFMNPLSITQKN